MFKKNVIGQIHRSPTTCTMQVIKSHGHSACSVMVIMDLGIYAYKNGINMHNPLNFVSSAELQLFYYNDK